MYECVCGAFECSSQQLVVSTGSMRAQVYARSATVSTDCITWGHFSQKNPTPTFWFQEWHVLRNAHFELSYLSWTPVFVLLSYFLFVSVLFERPFCLGFLSTQPDTQQKTSSEISSVNACETNVQFKVFHGGKWFKILVFRTIFCNIEGTLLIPEWTSSPYRATYCAMIATTIIIFSINRRALTDSALSPLSLQTNGTAPFAQAVTHQ